MWMLHWSHHVCVSFVFVWGGDRRGSGAPQQVQLKDHQTAFGSDLGSVAPENNSLLFTALNPEALCCQMKCYVTFRVWQLRTWVNGLETGSRWIARCHPSCSTAYLSDTFKGLLSSFHGSHTRCSAKVCVVSVHVQIPQLTRSLGIILYFCMRLKMWFYWDQMLNFISNVFCFAHQAAKTSQKSYTVKKHTKESHDQ